MTMYYSPESNGFYPHDMKSLYDEAGSWPSDAVQITDDEYLHLLDGVQSGKNIGLDQNGRPALVDRPPLTRDAVLAIRQAAYRMESDPLKIEAEHDAIVAGTAPDYSAWLAKVGEIKSRYPLPL